MELDSKRLKPRDQLLELPDGVLSTIISLLPFREAVRTSILCKQWRFIWTWHSHLRFDSSNELSIRASGTISQSNPNLSRLQRLKFVERVDHIMHQRCKGPKIDSFTIYLHLGQEFSSHIDNWIRCAVLKGVESIDLGLSKSLNSRFYNPSTEYKPYKFDYSLLATPGRKCNVKHLILNSCAFNVPTLSSNSLSCSLITVELRRVCISDELLNNLLFNCLLLEKLTVHLCQGLVNLKIAGPRLGRLNFVRIQDCFRLNEIEISSESLVRLEYIGSPISFCFKCVPKLAQVYLGYTGRKNRPDGVAYALTRLASQLTRLEKLNLVSVLSMNAIELPDDGAVFPNVKQLFLTVYPFDDEDRLSWIAYILRAFPMLQKLQLNLFSPSFIKQPKAKKKIERLLPECPHKHVKEVEMNGFSGNGHEVELLIYLVENMIELKVLIVDVCQKVFKGLDKWVYEEANSMYKWRAKSVYDWLHEIVPKSVHFHLKVG